MWFSLISAMVCSQGESPTLHTLQMISNKEMAIASATTDVLRTKGMTAYRNFSMNNVEDILKLRTKLSADETNFNAFGSERRGLMLHEYATGVLYFASLSGEEQAGILAVAKRQYDQNNQTMVSWLLGGFVIIALVVGLFAGNSGIKDSSNQSQYNSRSIPQVIA